MSRYSSDGTLILKLQEIVLIECTDCGWRTERDNHQCPRCLGHNLVQSHFLDPDTTHKRLDARGKGNRI